VDKILYKNIIATITYYDVLEYPLTSFQIWKHLLRYSADDTLNVWSLTDIIYALKDEHITKYISHKNGMYFLFGREKLVYLRRSREYISFPKMCKLKRIISILRISPFVRMICVTGRLSYYNCDKESDLDIFVVYKTGHIWTGRFIMTVLTQIMGVRRYGHKTNNRVCLNYHITTDSLQVPTQDLFASHEYTFITPIFDVGYFDEFCKKNLWIKNYRPHHKCSNINHTLTISDNVITKTLRKISEMILGDKAMEKRLKKIQQKKIIENPKTQQEGALIMHNDDCLVFLPKPHGPEVFEEYKKRFDALELSF
jgi:hypothetical protein